MPDVQFGCLFLADEAERLDHSPGDSTGRGHVAGCGPLQYDFLTTDSHMTCRAIRQEDNLHRDLIGQSQQIGGVGARSLETDRVTRCQGLGNGIRIRSDQPDLGVQLGVIVQAPGKAPDRALLNKAGKRNPDCGLASQIKKGVWCEAPATSLLPDPLPYLLVEALHAPPGFPCVRKIAPFS